MIYKKPFILFIFLFLFSCTSKSDEVVKRKGEPDVHILYNDDSEMNNAIEKAKSSIDQFRKAIISQNPNYYNFALKKRFKINDIDGEHIWISDIQYYKNKYYGLVDGIPISTKEVKLGDTIEVALEDISDWLYVYGNKVKGAYTTRVLRTRMTEKEKKEMDSLSGLIFE
ncbi:YegJ family protein [Epilithonimonas hispanica]|uniref:DUF2314 domain-containing protein n=1 Tax=Epilithonimonas hispanica TaxID=358687 RepID=A0A3D9CTP5_9FLAO|nr:DUF2314 domain-containing protein [Epilithonimonas hispanica]REC69146.1 hypothetical protein DRF58_12940 [Epilithonimonas hispanica]